jgi:hypothetical protein
MSLFGFNLAQELFLVLFSILYGVMLGSVSRLQAFPLERSIKGFVDRWGNRAIYCVRGRWGKIRCNRNEFTECYQEFLKEAEPKKTFQSWLVCMWRKRIAWSIILLNALPALYLWFVLSALGEIKTIQETLDPFNFAVIFWAALAVFGFYRFYLFLISWKWKSLFCDVAKKFEADGTSFDAVAHFVWGCVYLLPPIHLLIWIAYF